LISINQSEDKNIFVHGLSVGLGCIAAFIIMWIVVFFSPQLPSTITYEAMLSVFIYPLVYLLAVGLIALTTGIVRVCHVRKTGFKPTTNIMFVLSLTDNYNNLVA